MRVGTFGDGVAFLSRFKCPSQRFKPTYTRESTHRHSANCGASNVRDKEIVVEGCGFRATLTFRPFIVLLPESVQRDTTWFRRRVRISASSGMSVLSIVAGLSSPDAIRHDNRARKDHSAQGSAIKRCARYGGPRLSRATAEPGDAAAQNAVRHSGPSFSSRRTEGIFLSPVGSGWIVADSVLVKSPEPVMTLTKFFVEQGS